MACQGEGVCLPSWPLANKMWSRCCGGKTVPHAYVHGSAPGACAETHESVSDPDSLSKAAFPVNMGIRMLSWYAFRSPMSTTRSVGGKRAMKRKTLAALCNCSMLFVERWVPNTLTEIVSEETVPAIERPSPPLIFAILLLLVLAVLTRTGMENRARNAPRWFPSGLDNDIGSKVKLNSLMRYLEKMACPSNVGIQDCTLL